MPKHKMRGAVMLEMALVSVVFFLLIFSLLDLMRYIAIKASLVRGAQAGLTLAQQISGFEQDVRRQPLGSPPMNNLSTARRSIIDAATTGPLSFLIEPSTAVDSFAKLTNFENQVPYGNVGAVWSTYRDPLDEMAAVIRPGEYACDEGASGPGGCGGGSAVFLCHPTKVDPNGNCPPTVAVPAVTSIEPWASLLSEHVLMVKLRAEVKPLMSWAWPGQTWVVESTELGFREPIRNSRILPDMNIPVRPILPPPPTPTAAPPPTLICCCLNRNYFTGVCVSSTMQTTACGDPC